MSFLEERNLKRGFPSTGDNSKEMCDQVCNTIPYGGTGPLVGTQGNYLWLERKVLYKSRVRESRHNLSPWVSRGKPYVQKCYRDNHPQLGPVVPHGRTLFLDGEVKAHDQEEVQPLPPAKHL